MPKTKSTKYTPGPWRISGFEKTSSDRVIMGADNFSVASVGERTKAENIANASLIAAAPALLEALNHLIAAVVRKGCNDPEETGEEESARLLFAVMGATDNAKAAIAKATKPEERGS